MCAVFHIVLMTVACCARAFGQQQQQQQQSVPSAPPQPTGLMVDFKHSPSLGVRTDKPEFTWIVPPCQQGGGADHTQIAYRVNVTTGAGIARQLVWSSGRVDSAASVGVPYDGPALEPGAPFQWTVTTWTQQVQHQQQQHQQQESARFNVTGSCESSASAPGLFLTALGDAGFSNSTMFVSTPNASATFGYFRKEIAVPDDFVSAQAFVTAQGDDRLFAYYKFYIDGSLVDVGPGRGEAPVFGGDGVFRALPYGTLDVTSFFAQNKGKNASLALVGMQGRAAPYAMLQLQFRLSDGTVLLLGSTDASWRAFNGDVHRNPGPGQHGGSAGTKFIEYIDARHEPVGWKLVGFDDSTSAGWAPAEATPPTASDVSNLFPKMEPPMQAGACLPCTASQSHPTTTHPTHRRGAWLDLVVGSFLCCGCGRARSAPDLT